MAQERVARAGHAVLKWLATIAGSVITAVLVWKLTDGNGPPAPTPQNPPEENEPAPAVCHVDGAVYDAETKQPLAAIEVRYYRQTQDPNKRILEGRLATTAPDGRFSADCSSLETETFPFQLVLVGRNWRRPHHTTEYVRRGETRHDVNIYVSDQNLRDLVW